MKETERHNPLDLIAGSDGMTVPEGYFVDFAAKMDAAIPEREPKVIEMPRTWWQKVRPYAYLAAMFAGIWCMLQMFSLMGGVKGSITPDNNPVLAEAINNDGFMDDYYYMPLDEQELIDDLYASGLDIASL